MVLLPMQFAAIHCRSCRVTAGVNACDKSAIAISIAVTHRIAWRVTQSMNNNLPSQEIFLSEEVELIEPFLLFLLTKSYIVFVC